ncbi:MAG: hypothetical protein ACXVCM_23010 [Ktedonobacteraceae bacterium]
MNKKYIHILALLLAACLLAFSDCEINISTNGTNNPLVGISPSSNTPQSSGTSHLGAQIKTSGCVAQGGLPDSACTLGAIFTNATTQQICAYGYSSSVRNVLYSEKDQVENYLHDQVCSRAMSLQDAQTHITTNWLAVYHRMPTKYQ